MNKYFILLIGLALLIGSGIIYRVFLIPESKRPVDTGIVKEVTIRILKNSWAFEPEEIRVERGDTLKLTFVNEDDYDHGVGVDAYGISQRIPAKATLAVPPFVVTKAGVFTFYCSVSCGEGVAEGGKYQGQPRTHFDQTGKIIVVDPKDPNAVLETFDTKESDDAALVPPAPEATSDTEFQEVD